MSNSDDTSSSSTEHDMEAEAFVPLDAEMGEYGLEAVQQLDMSIERWVCSCGQSWEDRASAEDHLRSVRPEVDHSTEGLDDE